MTLEEQLRNCRPALDEAIEVARTRVTEPRDLTPRRRSRVLIGALVVIVGLVAASLAFVVSKNGNGGDSISAVNSIPVRRGRFQIALITTTSAPPCAPGQYHDPSAPAANSCLTLAAPIIRNADVAQVDVAYDPDQGAWIVDATLTPAAGRRLANVPVANGPRTAAIVIDDRVLSTPVVNPGITGHAMQIAPSNMNRAQAIALATRITGHAPSHVASPPPANDPMTQARELCQRHLHDTPGAQAVGAYGPGTAKQAAAALLGLGRDPQPWNHLPPDELVAQCSYFNSAGAASVSILVDAAGHRTPLPPPF